MKAIASAVKNKAPRMALGSMAAVLACASLPAGAASDWVKDWFAQSVTTDPGHYQSQQRGYYTAGGFNARYRLTNDNLVSITPPSIHVGCGGIDLMGGSMSYLNAKYLVQKLQSILQAAPAFAFNIALQEYCKECEAALNYLDHITDELNGLQLNDCQAANGLAHAIVNPSTIEPQLQGLAAQATATVQGISDSWEAVESSVQGNNGQAPSPATNFTSGCPAGFQQIFTKGSVVENALSYVGLPDYSPIIEGLIGDVRVNFDSTSNNYSIVNVAPCPGNDKVGGDDFLSGTIQVQYSGASCYAYSGTSILSTVDANMQALAGALQSGGTLSPAQQTFVKQAPLPMYLILRDATVSGTSQDVIGLLDQSLADGYTYRVLSDFYGMFNQVIDRMTQISQQTMATGGGNANQCNTTFLAPALDNLQTMRDRAERYRSMAQQAFANSEQEALANINLASAYYAMHQQVQNHTGTALDKGKSQ